MKKGRKKTGGKYKKARKKKHYEKTGQKNLIKLGEGKRKTKKVRGGLRKISMLNAKFISVLGKGKGKKVEIKNVLETPSNRFLARQQVITKGSIVETELGRVRVTNRPSQQGIINGVLVE